MYLSKGLLSYKKTGSIGLFTNSIWFCMEMVEEVNFLSQVINCNAFVFSLVKDKRIIRYSNTFLEITK